MRLFTNVQFWLVFSKGLVHSGVYECILLLNCAMYILCSERLCRLYLQEAESFLRQFVKKAGRVFGLGFMTSNTHLALHLPQAARRFGSVEKVQFKKYSIMKTIHFFENYAMLMNAFHGKCWFTRQETPNIWVIMSWKLYFWQISCYRYENHNGFVRRMVRSGEFFCTGYCSLEFLFTITGWKMIFWIFYQVHLTGSGLLK